MADLILIRWFLRKQIAKGINNIAKGDALGNETHPEASKPERVS
jgi:hypothetical protein